MEKQSNFQIFRKFFRIFFYVILLIILYELDFPLSFIVFLGFLFLFSLFVRGKIYEKTGSFFLKQFPFLLDQKPIVRKILVFIIFLLVYVSLKQVIYSILEVFGINIQGMIIENFNISLGQ
jgi:hypothetical protein